MYNFLHEKKCSFLWNLYAHEYSCWVIIVSPFLVLKGNAKLYQFTLIWVIQFLRSFASIWCCHFSYFDHSGRCGVIPHGGFYLRSSNGWWCWTSFRVLLCHLAIVLGEMSVHVFCPISNWIVFKRWVLRVLYIFYIRILGRQVICTYFLPTVACLFILLMGLFEKQIYSVLMRSNLWDFFLLFMGCAFGVESNLLGFGLRVVLL